MHGHQSPEEFLAGISGFLGIYYLLLATMNALMAFYLWQSGKSKALVRLGPNGTSLTTAQLCMAVAVLFTIVSPIAMSGNASLITFISMPEALRALANRLMGPTVYTVGTLGVLSLLFLLRKWVTKPAVAWTGLNLALVLMGVSMTDPNFALIVTKPDNVPIVGLVFLLGFFTWLAAHRAVRNDERTVRGEEPLEKLDREKVLVWPDLVYTELICMVVITAILLLWGIGLMAPLEEPASSVKTPNPSKAPWYFLGLQEMLVYYDPWMAGVVLPSLVIFGLMAIPFLDFNKKGSGYYTINERKFAYLTFQFGFLVLWVTLIVMGTFLRGPNWNFFGPYEHWDPHKVEALNNVDLSQYFWVGALGQGRPKAPEGSSMVVEMGYIAYREAPGIILLVLYLTAIPPALVVFSKFFQKMFIRMGFIRYMVMTNLLLMMGLLPLKMACRWLFNMKYFIAIPEFFLNL
jgi:hypothetical protein